MASSADIRAGRAFVELYVRDYLFRQRLLEDRAMLEDVMADAGERGPSDQGITTTGDAYAELADIADQSLETLYQDTLYLTEATEELLEVLNEVMDTYLGLSDIQTEGVSLAVGGPQQAGIGGPGGEQRFGFSLSDMKKQLGEGMEGVPEVAVKAVGAKIGAAIFRSDAFQNALSYLPFTKTIRQGASKEGAGGQAGTELSVPVMQLLNQAFVALGQSAVLAAQALQALSRSGGGGGGPVIDVAFKAKGLETVHDEMITALAPVEFHSPGVLPITVSYTADTAELAGLPAPGDVVDAELVDSVQSANVVMAQLAKSTSGADTSLARLAQSLQSAGTAIPVVGQDVEKAGQAVGMMTKAFHAAKWALTTLGPWLIAIAAAVAAAYAAFKTLQLAVAAVKLPFQVAAKAVEWFVAGIKSLPNLIGWTVGALKRLTVAGYEAAKSLGVGVWSGVAATFRGINSAISAVGSTIKATGKGLAYLGAGITALGALITVPLTKAAQKFAEMGNHIKVLTEQYKVFGMTAEQASVYSYAASQASGLLGTLGEAERIQYLMRTMRTGTAEYEKWRKQAELSGAVMTGGALAGAKVLTEAYHRLTGALQGLWASLGQAVGPAVADWTEIVVGAIRGATQWVLQNQQLIATVFKVATTIGTVGSVIAAAGTALMGLGAAISPLTALLAAVAAGMAVVEYKTRVGATLWGAYSDSVVKLYGTVMTFLKPILEETKTVIGGIVDAVKGGDLALAAKIAWAGLKLAWSEGLLWLSEQTGETFGGVLKNLAGGNWKAAADGAVGMIKAAFLELKLLFSDIWDGLRDGLDSAITSLMPLLDKLKVFALDVLQWIEINVFLPMVRALDRLDEYDPTGMMKKATSAGYDAVREVGNFRREQQEKLGSPEKQAEAQAQRQEELQSRIAERQNANAARRKEIETQIAELQKRGVVEGTVSGNKARSQTAELRDELAQLNQEAAKLKKEGEQPKLPEYLGKTSGLISSSAYAFGSLGMGGGSVQDRQLEVQRKTLEEARKKEVAERASRNAITKVLEAQRDRLAEMTEYMKKMGIFGAT